VLAAEITDALLTTAVMDREPTDILEVLPRESGTISCFTRVVGAQGEIAVGEMPNGRTRSVKELIKDSPGSRRVEIQDADGNLLRELSGS
jgi:hypothetical protein